jgi:exopolysaccharide production protein ExoQ
VNTHPQIKEKAMNKSSNSSADIRSIDPDHADVYRASLPFLALAVSVVTMVYMMPLSESWFRSTFEHYTDESGFATSASEGTLSHQIALGSLGLFGLAAIFWPGGKLLRVRGLLGLVCVAYLVWCLATCLWTENFYMTSRRCIALACEVAAGLGIAKRASVRQFVWIVFACTLAWLGLGLLAELSLGTFRPWAAGYRFAGIFHPNEMGVNCALLGMAAIYLARDVERGRRWLYASAAAALFFLLLTGSRTALGALVLSVIATWYLKAPAGKKLVWGFVAGFTLISGTLLYSMSSFELSTDAVTLGRTDRDMSALTGRLPLWQELIQHYVIERPLLGHGYGAFWTAEHIDEVSKSQFWSVQSTHSSYIDLLLNVGLVGAAFCLVAMLLAWLGATRLERQDARAGYGVMAIIVAYGLVDGLCETTIGITYPLSFFCIASVSILVVQGMCAKASEGAIVKSGNSSPRGISPLTRRRSAIA